MSVFHDFCARHDNIWEIDFLKDHVKINGDLLNKDRRIYKTSDPLFIFTFTEKFGKQCIVLADDSEEVKDWPNPVIAGSKAFHLLSQKLGRPLNWKPENTNLFYYSQVIESRNVIGDLDIRCRKTKDIFELLDSFDLPCCRVATDGKKFWASLQALHAIFFSRYFVSEALSSFENFTKLITSLSNSHGVWSDSEIKYWFDAITSRAAKYLNRGIVPVYVRDSKSPDFLSTWNSTVTSHDRMMCSQIRKPLIIDEDQRSHFRELQFVRNPLSCTLEKIIISHKDKVHELVYDVKKKKKEDENEIPGGNTARRLENGSIVAGYNPMIADGIFIFNGVVGCRTVTEKKEVDLTSKMRSLVLSETSELGLRSALLDCLNEWEKIKLKEKFSQ